jgi:hypothetical protein
VASEVNNAAVRLDPSRLLPGRCTGNPVSVPVPPDRTHDLTVPLRRGRRLIIGYVIAAPCIQTMDGSSTQECPVDFIDEGDSTQHIRAKEDFERGAYEPVHPVEVTAAQRRAAPGHSGLVEVNAKFLTEALTGCEAATGAPRGSYQCAPIALVCPMLAER